MPTWGASPHRATAAKPKSKILFAVGGSRGDTQPPIAFAVELARAGHRVLLLIPPDYAHLVPKVDGLSFLTTPFAIAETIEPAAPALAAGSVAQVGIRQFAALADAVLAACTGCDIVICTAPMLLPCMAVAELKNISVIHANVHPILPTAEAFFYGGKTKIHMCLNVFIYKLFNKDLIMSKRLEAVIREWRVAHSLKPEVPGTSSDKPPAAQHASLRSRCCCAHPRRCPTFWTYSTDTTCPSSWASASAPRPLRLLLTGRRPSNTP